MLVHYLIKQWQYDFAQVLGIIHALRPVLAEFLSIFVTAGNEICCDIVKYFLRRLGASSNINYVAEGILIKLCFNRFFQKRKLRILILSPWFWCNEFRLWLQLRKLQPITLKVNFFRLQPRHLIIIYISYTDFIARLHPLLYQFINYSDTVGADIQEMRPFCSEIYEVFFVSAIE